MSGTMLVLAATVRDGGPVPFLSDLQSVLCPALLCCSLDVLITAFCLFNGNIVSYYKVVPVSLHEEGERVKTF